MAYPAAAPTLIDADLIVHSRELKADTNGSGEEAKKSPVTRAFLGIWTIERKI